MADLHFYVEGEQAEATAAALEALLLEQFGRAPRRQLAPPPTSTRADPLAVLAIAIALPGAIDDVLTLAERLKLKDRIQRLAEFAGAQRRRRGGRIWVRHGRRVEPLPLDEARLDELLKD